MKIYLIILLSILSYAVNAQSNKYLILKHRDKQKEVVIAQGEYVVIESFKGDKIRGQMEVLSETLIRVKHKVVPLTNVKSVGRRNAKIMRVATVLVSTGMNISLYGLSDNLRHGWEKPSENYKAGLPMLAVGIPFMAITFKRTSENWTYEGTVGAW
jgi:hypothetical protein